MSLLKIGYLSAPLLKCLHLNSFAFYAINCIVVVIEHRPLKCHRGHREKAARPGILRNGRNPQPARLTARRAGGRHHWARPDSVVFRRNTSYRIWIIVWPLTLTASNTWKPKTPNWPKSSTLRRRWHPERYPTSRYYLSPSLRIWEMH